MNPPALREPRDESAAKTKPAKATKRKKPIDAAEPVAAPLAAPADVPIGPDPVMELAGRLPAIYAAVNSSEVVETHERKTDGHPSRSDRFFDLTMATEAVIARTQATSVEGALVQIALASNRAHRTRDIVEDEYLRNFAEDTRWLLCSAVPVIEAATGVRCPEVCREHYMIDEQSPFRQGNKGARDATPTLASDDSALGGAHADAALMGLIAKFHTAYGGAIAAHDKWIGKKHRVEALPDCPPFVIPAEDREAHERHHNFLGDHGVWALADRSTELWRETGALANAVFTSPARTVAVATEKLKIVRLSLGDHGDDGDPDLIAFEPRDGESWLASVMRDFERLAKGASAKPVSDPMVELATRYLTANEEFQARKEGSDDDNDAFVDNVQLPLEQELMKARPATREGVIAALDVVMDACKSGLADGESFPMPLVRNALAAVRGAPLPALSIKPDPVMALVRQFETAKAARKSTVGKTDDEVEAEASAFYDDVEWPFKARLVKTPPTTREGVAAILDIAIEGLAEKPGRGAGDYRFALLENVLAAVKGGVS